MRPWLGAAPPGLPLRDLVAAVRAVIDRVLAPGVRAGLAVSGGADSAGMALLTRMAREDLDLLVLHIRHGLRDDAADAAAAAGVAEHLGVPVVVRAVRVEAGSRHGPEAAARRARHEALRALASEHHLTAVLLGHTAEDQAETVLLNLVRGTGLGGLGGMRTVRAAHGALLVRPALALRRADVRAVVDAEGVRTIEDPTNADPEQRRARARADVLPRLAALAGGPGDPVAALTRVAALAADDDALLRSLSSGVGDALVLRLGGARLVERAVLAGLPVALARRVVRAALAQVRGGTEDLAALDVEVVRTLSKGDHATVSGAVVCSASLGWLVLRPQSAPSWRPRALPPEGRLPLPEVGAALVVERGNGSTRSPASRIPASPSPDRATAAGALAAALVHEAGQGPVQKPPDPLWWPLGTTVVMGEAPTGWRVRPRQPGDVVRSGGRTRPLRDLQRAAGVPRGVRSTVPVVVDGDGEIRWVPGLAVAVGASGTGHTRLRLVPLP